MATPGSEPGAARALRSAGKSAAILAGVAVFAFGLIALMHEATRDDIAAASRARLLTRFDEVLAGESYDNDLLADRIELTDSELLGTTEPVPLYRARRAGRVVAVVLAPAAPRGYSGPIHLLVGIRSDGQLLGVRVTQHRETPGLGDRIETRQSPWILGFAGRSFRRSSAGALDREKGWRRFRSIHRRHDHAARGRGRGGQCIDLFRTSSRGVAAAAGYNRAMTPAAIIRAGLRDQNPGLVQLLGLCPLLAISTSLASGLGLGLATLCVLTASNVAASLVGRALPAEIRIAVFVVLIAALVTAVELALAAWLTALHAALGIFLPLIVTNCLLLARAEAFASRQSIPRAALDGVAMGSGFLLVLATLGAVRELLGRGSLGADFATLFGLTGQDLGWHVFDERHGLLFALLPPGAFILLGLMVAAHNARRAARAIASPAPAPTLSPAPATVAPDTASPV